MTKDFVLVTGHGIFQTSTILQVVPVTDVHFDLNLEPPSDSDSKFIFSVRKSVSINAEVARSNPTKKNEVETLTDYGYNQQFSDEFDFAQDEFLSMVALDEDETVKSHLKDYARRLKKYLDYQAAVTAIENNPDLPDYASSLAAVKSNAPGDSYIRKQEKTQAKLQAYVLDHIMTIVESASDDDDDYQGKALMDVLNSEDRLDAIENAANIVLKDFYRKNFSPYYDDDEDTDEAADFEDVEDREEIIPLSDKAMADRVRENASLAVSRGLEIMRSPDTISNTKDNDEEDITEYDDTDDNVKV
jgi:hypothetical protein